jgi:hypothetical protein
MPWRSQQKFAETLVEYRFCKSFDCFAIIKSAKSWLGMRAAALYFYIINNGSTVKEERRIRATRSEKLHPNKI